MEFYVKRPNGDLKRRISCDNPDCPYFGVLAGIPRGIKLVCHDGKYYCSIGCLTQGPAAEARYTAKPLAPIVSWHP